MTQDSDAARPRFRTARVVTPQEPEERLEQLLGDGERLSEVFTDAVVPAARAGDWQRVVGLARIAARAEDRFRAYAAQRQAASLLVAASSQLPHDDTWAWVEPLDAVVDLLVPVLEATPQEPALLDLLGVAVYELGHTPLARRLFEAVRELEPQDPSARQHLRACRERLQAPQRIRPVEEGRTPSLARARAHVKRIAERATRLEDATISLCMIVKDEEEQLPGCLAAVAPFVDELVIVDTGSTDRTVEIAREYGARVVEFAWNGSFSDARNESLRHATGDWILWLDADEHLVVEDGPKLRDLVRRSWVEGYHVVETHFLGGDERSGSATHAPMRLFRRRPEYVWRGTIHEQVAWSLPNWLPGRVQHSDVRVDHYGYLAAVVADRGKHERNLELLMRQIATERTGFACFNVGTEHAAMGSWAEARRWFEEALRLVAVEAGWQQEQFAPLLVQRAIVARRATGDHAASIELATQAASWWPQYTDLVYERAVALQESERLEEAAATAREAIAMGDAPARFVAVTGKGSFQARRLLASVLRTMGDADAALEQLELAVIEAPQFLGAVEEYADLLLEQGTAVAEASARVDAVLGERAGGAAANLLVGAIFHERGHFDEADRRYARVLQRTDRHPGALAARAELRLAQGRLREAWDDAVAIDELHPVAARGAVSAFLAAAAMDDPALLDEPARRIAASDALPMAERAFYVAWRARLQPEQAGVTTLVPHDPSAADALFRNLEALIRLEATDAFERLHGVAAQVLPDERQRRMAFADLYLRRSFPDLAGEELMACAERFGPDAAILTGLGKVATMKGMWEDAEVLLSESLQLEPSQPDARRLLVAVRERVAG